MVLIFHISKFGGPTELSIVWYIAMNLSLYDIVIDEGLATTMSEVMMFYPNIPAQTPDETARKIVGGAQISHRRRAQMLKGLCWGTESVYQMPDPNEGRNYQSILARLAICQTWSPWWRLLVSLFLQLPVSRTARWPCAVVVSGPVTISLVGDSCGVRGANHV